MAPDIIERWTTSA